MVAAAEQRAAGLETAALQIVHLVAAHDFDVRIGGRAAVAFSGLAIAVARLALRRAAGRRVRLAGGRLGRIGSVGSVRRRGRGIASGRTLVLVPGPVPGATFVRSGRGVVVRLVGADGLLLLVERLPILDRDLVVVGVDLVEGKKTVAIAAIVDERRLERGLHAHYLGEIDISLELLLGSRFEVEFF